MVSLTLCPHGPGAGQRSSLLWPSCSLPACFLSGASHITVVLPPRHLMPSLDLHTTCILPTLLNHTPKWLITPTPTTQKSQGDPSTSEKDLKLPAEVISMIAETVVNTLKPRPQKILSRQPLIRPRRRTRLRARARERRWLSRRSPCPPMKYLS